MKERAPKLSMPEFQKLHHVVHHAITSKGDPLGDDLIHRGLLQWQEMDPEEDPSGQERLPGMPKPRRLVLTRDGLRAFLAKQDALFQSKIRELIEAQNASILKAREKTDPKPFGKWDPNCSHENRDDTFTCVHCKTCCAAEQRDMTGGCINCGAPCW